MKKKTARRIFEEAQEAVGYRADWADIERVQTWRDLDEQEFLSQYCWVVFASGFRVAVVEKYFEDIEDAVLWEWRRGLK